MADVFISYCRSEGTAELVRRIAGELERRGFTYWYDTKEQYADDFVERILTEIDHCKVFLFVWDEKSNKAPFYVRREVHTAANAENIALVPFVVGTFELNNTLTFYFSIINRIYGGNSPAEAETAGLLDAIEQKLGSSTAPPTQPAPAPTAPPQTEPRPVNAFERGKPRKSSAPIVHIKAPGTEREIFTGKAVDAFEATCRALTSSPLFGALLGTPETASAFRAFVQTSAFLRFDKPADNLGTTQFRNQCYFALPLSAPFSFPQELYVATSNSTAAKAQYVARICDFLSQQARRLGRDDAPQVVWYTRYESETDNEEYFRYP